MPGANNGLRERDKNNLGIMSTVAMGGSGSSGMI
jgi:hypothetical protein